jgi:hypothetical protein
MFTEVDAQLREEAKRYRLRFACPDCAYFESETRTCSEGYPNHDHVNPELHCRQVVVFCKSFELS